MSLSKTILGLILPITFIFLSCDEEKCEEYLPPELSFEYEDIRLHSEDSKSGFLVETVVSNLNGKCSEVAKDIYLIISSYYKETTNDRWDGIILNVEDTDSHSFQNIEILLIKPTLLRDFAVCPLENIASGNSLVRKDFFRPNVTGYFKFGYELVYKDKDGEDYRTTIVHTDSIYIEKEECRTYKLPELFIPAPAILELENNEEKGFRTRMQIMNQLGFCRLMAKESKLGLQVFYKETSGDTWQQRALEKVSDTSYNIQDVNTTTIESVYVKQFLQGEYELIEKNFYTNTQGYYKVKYFIDHEEVVNEEDEENNTGETEEFYVHATK